jgi:hypothetical protein
LKNLDRAMLTFNLHNIGEVCFNHVFKRRQFTQGEVHFGNELTRDQ